MKKRGFELKGLNVIAKGSCFIRLKNKPDYFVHYLGEKNNEDKQYEIRKGYIGACVWTKENAIGFVQYSGAPNLEIVLVTDIVEDDGTRN